MSVREVYLESAAITATLLAHPTVVARWEAPSSLARLRVGGLTAHLAGQITQVPPVLDAPAVDERLSLTEHFARSTWLDGDLDSEVNNYIRRAAEEQAAAGAAPLLDAVAVALADLRKRLPAEPPDRVIQLPWGPWSLSLDDYLVTRLLELAVHCDDLATSLGVPTPAFPRTWFDTVISVLCGLATERHGQTALLRALSRAERAPRTITAL
ncbi:hypothetical protein BJY16_006816 [Actinoplanes octamycinicus]|uniref:Mycothiol-dependent maleylpyruvate isomerase metal-binding domain-containing protein n=1 Tax=Actinoplanes octamycinicus TaxID=135948 RepID=A0A7W7MAU6_9ACTN|nr:maleylpyruvate isomerase N-terminal domain-containing protein [Actinoplanes octamycinicus]MBB4743357.1 hypothetical protein [Actinoplanes octamycinicus]GIE61873.1 hypothetical protein Aoc01nite_72750 [Actinoplanes octamycinicus]